MRSVGVLLLAIAAVALALDAEPGAVRRPRTHAISTADAPAERVLTLLDVWSQSLVPSLPLERDRARAIRSGEFARAASLARRMRPALVRAEGFLSEMAHDPILRSSDSVDVEALRAAAAAWGAWASALLRQTSFSRDPRTLEVRRLEQHAVRLHQSAYATVDQSLMARPARG
jgi:hypothetical protein